MSKNINDMLEKIKNQKSTLKKISEAINFLNKIMPSEVGPIIKNFDDIVLVYEVLEYLLLEVKSLKEVKINEN